MHIPPVLLVLAAGAVTLAAGQISAPTARAQSAPIQSALAPKYRVSVQNLHTKRTAGSTEVTGRVVNIGASALTYTAVTAVFTDAAGQEVGSAAGYLLAGPLGPGQSAGFRAVAPNAPAGSVVSLRLREAGHAVAVDAGRLSAAQAPDRRLTTVR